MPVLPKPLAECGTCPLWGDGRGYILPEGSGSLGVLIIGEAGGESERREGLPFRPHAQAGSLLERVFGMCGYSRQQFRIANVLQCQPPRNWLAGAPYELDAINHCAVHRDRILRESQPRAVLALGDTSLRVLTGHTGTKRGVSALRGYVLPMLDSDLPVVASFHPAFIRRGKSELTSVLAHDLRKAVAVAQGTFSDYCFDAQRESMPAYQCAPSLDEARSFLHRVREAGGAVLAYDIETPRSAGVAEDEATDELAEEQEIESIQFSYAEGSGIFFPWSGGYIDVARELLALPHTKVGHNSWRFDNPRLARQGIQVAGVCHDTMWLWHHLQPDLPAGLQFVASFYGFPFPWKHLADSDPGFYGICDVDATLRVWRGGMAALAARGLTEGYNRHLVALDPILVAMSARGVPVDDAARRAFGNDLQREMDVLDAEIQAIVPDEAKPLRVYVKKANVIKPFLVNSHQQMLAYMRHRGHKVPTERGTGRETTAGEHLQKLFKDTKDPLYQLANQWRELQKMRSTYVDGWEPAADGCVHGQFYHETGTGQLNSRSPNMQNAPKHSDLAKKFRRIVHAHPQHKLLAFDYKAFHAQTLGFEAEDAAYLRLAKLDIHSFVAAHLLKLSCAPSLAALPDAELAAALVEIAAQHERIRNKKAKPALLGIGFGMGERKLYDMNRDSFSNLKEARELKALLKSLFPRVFQWQDEIRAKAHREGSLVSRWGYVRYFPDVYHRDPRTGLLAAGEHAEASIAFLPSNDAFGMMKEVMLALAERGWDSRYGLVNNIHDELMFHCPDALVEEALSNVRMLMEQPCQRLTNSVAPAGLSVAVEASVGVEWSAMEKIA